MGGRAREPALRQKEKGGGGGSGSGHLGQGGGELTSGESIFHLLPYLHPVYCYKAICDMRSHGFRLKVTRS